MAVEPPQGCIPVPYRQRRPAKTVLYRVVQEHFETYLSLCGEGNWDGSAVPAHVEREHIADEQHSGYLSYPSVRRS